MDRNLERNLARIGTMRGKGELAKARRKLSELAQDYPDTPPYRLELARVCLDLGDSHAAVNEIRTLVRQFPDERAEALAALQDHFEATGSLPCAQFLFEDHLARGEHDEVALVLERLAEPQLRQALDRYATKLSSLEGHPETGIGADPATNPTLRLTLWASFHCALALKDAERAAGHAFRLVRAGEDDHHAVLALLDRRSRTQPMAPALLAVLGEARARAGKTVEGLSTLLAAAERDAGLAERVEAIVADVSPLLTERNAVLRTQGHLARLQGRHDEAVARYREAIALEPQGAATLLDLIAPALRADGPEARPYALLRVELLARLGDGAGLAAALAELRDRPWITPDEVRATLAPHLGRDASPALLVAAAQAAVAAGDCDEFERLLAAAPPLPRLQAGPLLRALEQRLGLAGATPELVTDPATGEVVSVTQAAPAPAVVDPPAARRRWLRLLTRLHTGAGDAAGANARLELLWRDATDLPPEEAADLVALTRATYAAVAPAPSTLAVLLGPLVAAGAASELGDWLGAAAAADPAAIGALADALVGACVQDPALARSVGEAVGRLTGPAREALALPAAAARLFGGAETEGLRDLDALAASGPDGEERALGLLTTYCARRAPRADVALGAARLLRVDDRLDEAVALLRPALEADPGRADEVALFFESVLAAEPENTEVWLAYLDGLMRAGRWRRLLQVLPRAEQALPAAEIGRLRGYRARLKFEEGDLNGALQECELALQLASPPLNALADLLQAVLAVKPGLARAHKLLGDVATAAGRLDEGLRAHGQALRCDPALQGEILHATRRVTAERLLGGDDCLALARFYLEAGRGDEAARAYTEALQVAPDRAAEVARDLGDAVDGSGPFPALLQPLAQALRLGGHAAEAERAYTALYASDASRADWIFKELALLEAARPDDVGPLRARARILLAEKRVDDLERLLESALARPGRDEARWELAREFAGALRGETALLLAATTAVQTGRGAEAWRLLDRWAARGGEAREYGRACAVLEQLGESSASWPEQAIRHRVHLHGGRPDRALAALPQPAELSAAELQAAWAALAQLGPEVGASPAGRLQRARYLHARGEAEAALVEVETLAATPATAANADDGCRREAATLRGRLLAQLGRHDEARRALQDLIQAPGAAAETLDLLRQAHAAEARALAENLATAGSLDPAGRREVARRLALAGRPAEGLSLLSAPCDEPDQEQARRLAEAELLVLLDRPLEAADRLRAVPLAGAACRLPAAERVRGLWLLAHAEECRGDWSAACACYRLLAGLPGDADRARWWQHWSYGRLLEQTVEPASLVLEKTAVLG